MRLDVLMDDQTGQAFAQLAVGDERDVYRLVIPGRPVPAVRMTRRGKFVSRAAKRYLDYKNHVARIAMQARLKPVEGHVEVEGIVYIHGGREGDVDNYCKSLLDGLNGIAWFDDRQVRRATIEKRKVDTAAEERAEIVIRTYHGR